MARRVAVSIGKSNRHAFLDEREVDLAIPRACRSRPEERGFQLVYRGRRPQSGIVLAERPSMTAIHDSFLVLDNNQLERTLGGNGNMPLGGNVRQNINTNWGGSQTNIGTQIVNPPAPRPPTTRFEYLRQNPAARFGPPPYVNRPVR